MVDPYTWAKPYRSGRAWQSSSSWQTESREKATGRVHRDMYLLEASSESQRKRPPLQLTHLEKANLTLDQEGVFTKRELT